MIITLNSIFSLFGDMMSVLHNGFITKEDFKSVYKFPLYKRLEESNNIFRKIFSDVLEKYSERWTDDSFHQWSRVWEYPYIYNAIEEYANSKPMLKILDAGCGLSFFPFLIEKDYPDLEFYATDMDPNLIQSYETINEKLAQNVIFKNDDLRSLSYSDETFDVVYCLSVLEHTDDYRAIVDGFHRILKKGGRFIMTIDVSLDGDRRISVPDANELLTYLNGKFKMVNTIEEFNKDVKNENLLTTKYVYNIDKRLLPWRSPWKNALKNLMAFKYPRLTYNLACYCQVFEKV